MRKEKGAPVGTGATINKATDKTVGNANKALDISKIKDGYANFCKKPAITIKRYKVFSYVSLDTYVMDFDISEAGVEILYKYLHELRPYMKIGTMYGAGRTYSSVTVRTKIAVEVAEKFQKVFNEHKRPLPTIEEMMSASIGGRQSCKN